MTECNRRAVLKWSTAAGFTIGGSTVTSASRSQDSRIVDSLSVESSFIVETGHYGVVTPDDQQFVFAVIPSSHDRERYTLHVDDRTFSGKQHFASTRPEYVETDPSNGSTKLLGFSVPTKLSAERVKLTYNPKSGPQVQRPLGTKFTNQLSTEPHFEVAEVRLPSAARNDHTMSKIHRFPVSISVKNTGDRAGSFRATFDAEYYSGPNQYIDLSVPSGGERVWEGTQFIPSERKESETFVLDWGKGESHYTVLVK